MNVIVHYNQMSPRTHWVQRYEIPYDQTNLHHLDYNISTAETKWEQPHKHDEMEEYWYVLRGSMRVHQNESVTEVGADTLIIHQRGVWHRMECDDRCEWLCLAFHPRFAKRMREIRERQDGYGEHASESGYRPPLDRTILTPADLPAMGENGWQRFPTDRRLRDLDHWDINTWKPGRIWLGGHKHDDMEEYWYILDGTARVYQNEVMTEVGPHDFVIHPPGVMHRMETDTGCKWYCVMFNRLLAEALKDLLAKG